MRNTWVLLCGAAAIATGFFCATEAGATPASGFVGATLTTGQFGEIDMLNYLQTQDRKTWLSLMKTKGASDVYVQMNIWAPSGTTGWHTHPGASLIVVTGGAVTVYDGDDPDCKPTVYTQGKGFVDPGGEHVHLIRNEGSVVASTIAVQIIPAGAERRIDAPAPTFGCRF